MCIEVKGGVIMSDMTLIEKVCNLTCTKKEVSINPETVNFDLVNPFKKYYSIATLKGGLEKYLAGEWDAQHLSYWANLYDWILIGGSRLEIEDDLTSLEEFLCDVITWNLDGLSFFQEGDKDFDIGAALDFYDTFDHIWQTRGEWRASYAMIGKYAEINGEQYVALINDARKEYIILSSDHLENGFADEHFAFITRNAYAAMLEKLQSEFYGSWCDDAAGAAEIAELFKDQNYLCDTHTAVAVAAGKEYRKSTGDETLQLIASTASAYKFAPAVLAALTDEVLSEDDFEKLEKLSNMTATAVPAPLAALKGDAVLHTECINKEDMAGFIKGKLV